MCEVCYEEYGSPAPGPDALACVPLIAAVYEEDGVGGNLHAIIDDWNLDDVHFEIAAAGFTAAELACFQALKVLPLDQRAAALAVHDGYWPQK